jgi:hypothetical protein
LTFPLGGLSPQELEKIYRVVVFLKEEFITSDEARYYTPSWIQAEQEATEAHARGGLARFHSVRELAEYIEANTADRRRTTNDQRPTSPLVIRRSSLVKIRRSAVVLADEDQLEALARLRFAPQGTDELGALVAAS